MNLDESLRNQSIILDVVSALQVDERKKLHICGVLYGRHIEALLQNKNDLAAVKSKLMRKRVTLSPKQRDLALVVEHLADFEGAIGPWVTNFAAGDIPYAIEHVLMGYDAASRTFL